VLRYLRKHAAQAVLIPAMLFATSPIGVRATTGSTRSHGTAHRAHAKTDYPAPAGYSSWKFSDPECPDSPDSYEWYIEYWNEDASFSYDVDAAAYTTYWCDGHYKSSPLANSYEYSQCVANSPAQWNCQFIANHETPHS